MSCLAHTFSPGKLIGHLLQLWGKRRPGWVPDKTPCFRTGIKNRILLYFLAAALWRAFTILPTNLDSFTSWILLADSNFNAPTGHMRTQAGSRPASTLSIHRLHFCIFSSWSYLGTPKGHAKAQLWHPMHSSRLTMIAPVRSSLVIAPVGQPITQGLSSQCTQAAERYWMLASGNSPP